MRQQLLFGHGGEGIAGVAGAVRKREPEGAVRLNRLRPPG
jgi:hypothetical protein